MKTKYALQSLIAFGLLAWSANPQAYAGFIHKPYDAPSGAGEYGANDREIYANASAIYFNENGAKVEVSGRQIAAMSLSQLKQLSARIIASARKLASLGVTQDQVRPFFLADTAGLDEIANTFMSDNALPSLNGNDVNVFAEQATKAVRQNRELETRRDVLFNTSEKVTEIINTLPLGHPLGSMRNKIL